jgi:peptidoglycan hydrolase-like protein with peptidoglycan-binding domain
VPFSRKLSGGIALALGCVLVFSAPVAAGPKVAAVQVALKRLGLYSATVDGVRGPLTKAAIVRRIFQLFASEQLTLEQTCRMFGYISRSPCHRPSVGISMGTNAVTT